MKLSFELLGERVPSPDFLHKNCFFPLFQYHPTNVKIGGVKLLSFSLEQYTLPDAPHIGFAVFDHISYKSLNDILIVILTDLSQRCVRGGSVVLLSL